MISLPAEWAPQQAVLLTWPHQDTDWQALFDEAQSLYYALVNILLDYVDVVISVHPDLIGCVSGKLASQNCDKRFTYTTFAAVSNDTWARDHGPVSVINAETKALTLLNFTFNAWGNKYASTLDNALTEKLHQMGAFGHVTLENVDFVLEGGAIESDGAGTLLTTERCLLNPNRNPDLSSAEIERTLKETLGIKKVLWLKSGYLAGDDTDSHIDTLARFAPGNIITYVSCDDAKDEHFASLKALESELTTMTNAEGKSFTLIPLPLPSAIYDEDNSRLPATYANYLITNGAVIVPTYGDDKDNIALSAMNRAFPERDIIGLDCNALIKQHGSLHCITMQIPR